MDVMTVHVVVQAPEYEESTLHLVCEDPEDAAFYARSISSTDMGVRQLLFVPKGRRDLVVEMQVWRAEVDVRPETGSNGEMVGWTCDPARMWSRTEWRADDPEVWSNITRSGESAAALEQGRVQAWHVSAEGPTRGTTAKALDEKLNGLLRQLGDGTLTGVPVVQE